MSRKTRDCWCNPLLTGLALLQEVYNDFVASAILNILTFSNFPVVYRVKAVRLPNFNSVCMDERVALGVVCIGCSENFLLNFKSRDGRQK